MSCYQCSKTFGFFNKEMSCSKCRYSFCSSCLQHKLKLSSSDELMKVCRNCSLNRLEKSNDVIDIPKNLQKLKETNANMKNKSCDLEKRLQNLTKSSMPNSVSNEEIEERLRNLRGNKHSDSKVQAVTNTKMHIKPKSEQNQIDDLLDQMKAEVDLDEVITSSGRNQEEEIERRLLELKGERSQLKSEIKSDDNYLNADKIMEKIMAEMKIENKFNPESKDCVSDELFEELPYCCLCSEDARWRCIDCDGDLYCDSCYKKCHKKNEYGPHKYEEYKRIK